MKVERSIFPAFAIMIIGLMATISCGKDDAGDILVKTITVQGDYITDGESSQMTAIVTPANATNQEVEWSVSDVSVATISGEGLLTAVSNGTVRVTATAIDGSGVFGDRLIGVSGVFVPPILVESITVEGSDITDGKTEQFSADVAPVNAANKTVTWSVSDETMASINTSGSLTPLKNGSVTVIATAQDESGVSGQKTISISGVDEGVVGIIVENEAEFLTAITNVQPGEKIYVRAGTYTFNATIRITRDGLSGQMMYILPHPADDDRPLFDFSSMSESSGNRGISLSADHWYIKGLDIYKAGDNGMNISGSDNTIEFCTFFENADSGLQIGNGGANNTVINCDSYFNADSSIENADGFAAKLDCGSGNKFIGCRAWNNLDDGWDGYLRGADNVTTYYENCWAIRNGYLKNGSVGGGDGNGFKTGGSDDKLLRHNGVFKNCVAAGNVVDGFDHNSNRGEITLYNCSAYANGRNINFGSGNIAASLTIKNSLSFDGNGNDQYQATVTDVSNNSWQDGLNASASDFKSINIDLMLSPRKPDGSLPDIDFLHLVQGSDLIDAGVDVGLPYSGSAPDLGAFEFEP